MDLRSEIQTILVICECYHRGMKFSLDESRNCEMLMTSVYQCRGVSFLPLRQERAIMFYSILFPQKEQHTQSRHTEAPDCWGDLNIDQIFAPILKEKAEFELEGFFYTTLIDLAFGMDLYEKIFGLTG